MAVTSAAPEAGAFEITRPPRSLWGDAIHRLMRNKMAIAAVLVIVLLVALAILAPVIAPFDPNYMSREADPTGGGTRLPPAWQAGGNSHYLLGTDASGRDMVTRLMYGAQVSLMVGFIPTIIIVAMGLIIGMTAGYAGGRVDNLLMRITDVVYAFPDLLFIIIMISALRGTFLGDAMDGLLVIFIALAIVNWVGMARLVRGQVLSLKEKEFIEAARSIGTPRWRIMVMHLLPNSLAPIIVAATFAVPGQIITEAIFIYIGLGIRPPRATWGGMIQDGYSNINAAPHMVWEPATCIALVTLAFTFFGDGLRDALDPRMGE